MSIDPIIGLMYGEIRYSTLYEEKESDSNALNFWASIDFQFKLCILFFPNFRPRNRLNSHSFLMLTMINVFPLTLKTKSIIYNINDYIRIKLLSGHAGELLK